MKTSDFLGLILVGLFAMTGCVSTTTGSVTEPKRDDKEAAQLNYQLGARYYQQGSYELARDRLLLATEIDPKMALAFSTLALTYEALENTRLATEAYENALRAAPRNFDVQNFYAVFLCRQKEFDRARTMFDRAIAHAENDNSQVTMTNAGVCMMQKPDPVAAEKYFRAALEKKANFPEALLQLCLLKYGQEDYLGARAFLARYLTISPPTAELLFFASRIEGQLDNERGKKEFEDQLIRTFPSSEETRMVLGAD
jgi:type IV pilus assembly protein PilF